LEYKSVGSKTVGSCNKLKRVLDGFVAWLRLADCVFLHCPSAETAGGNH